MAAAVGHILEAASGTRGHQDGDRVTREPGAYLIMAILDRPFFLSIRSLPETTLPPGTYVYAGSARGRGGIRARAARHLRRPKQAYWHIDRLTNVASSLTAYPVRDGQECDLADALLESGNFAVPLPGFGSSDCRRCVSHLLRWRGGHSKSRTNGLVCDDVSAERTKRWSASAERM